MIRTSSWKRPICWLLGHVVYRFVWCRRCGCDLYGCRLNQKWVDRHNAAVDERDKTGKWPDIEGKHG